MDEEQRARQALTLGFLTVLFKDDAVVQKLENVHKVFWKRQS